MDEFVKKVKSLWAGETPLRWCFGFTVSRAHCSLNGRCVGWRRVIMLGAMTFVPELEKIPLAFELLLAYDINDGALGG